MKARLNPEVLERRDCPATGSTLIPVASGPGYSLSINSYGRFAVMQVSQAEYDALSGDVNATLAQREAITQRLYQYFPDIFDQVVLIDNGDRSQGADITGLYGINFGTMNDTHGIGTDQYNDDAGYGAKNNKLQSFIVLTDRAAMRDGVMEHEAFHRWANDLPNVLPGFASDGTGHWGLSSVGGILGGWAPGSLVSLGNGLYDGDGPNGVDGFAVNNNGGLQGGFPPDGGVPYAPLELYLMGVLPASEVPPIEVAINGVMIDDTKGIFSADGFQTFTIEDIIKAAGQRIPAVADAPHQFRNLAVLLTVAPPTQAEIDEVDTQVELYGKPGDDGDPNKFNFYEATGGRAVLQFDRLQEFLPGNRSVNSTLAVGADNLRVEGLTPGLSGTYDVTKPLQVNLSELLGDFTGDIRVATADVDGDGTPDFAFATGAGGITRFGVYNGKLTGFIIGPTAPFPGSEDFTGGAFVSAGDLDGDGKADIAVSADQGGGSRVVIYGSNGAILSDFLGLDDDNFRGGSRTAIGDVDGDGKADLAVAAGYGGGPRVALYSGDGLVTGRRKKLVSDFFAFPGADSTRLRNGVFISMGDLNGDLHADLVFGGGPGGAPRVYVLNGALIADGKISAAQGAPLANFFANNNQTERGGARVTVKYVDLDAVPDIVVGSGEGAPAQITVYSGAGLKPSGQPTILQTLPLFDELALPGGVYVG